MRKTSGCFRSYVVTTILLSLLSVLICKAVFAQEVKQPEISDYFSLRELTCSDMDKELIRKLLALRIATNRKIYIHSGYRKGDRGMHGKKKAFDIHIDGMSIFDQYIAAEKIGFGGIGVYPYWNNPGLHIDVRKDHKRWGRDCRGNYVALTSRFIKNICK